MKKQFTNVIVIDASSSMEDKKSSVISGLKELFQDIKSRAKADKEVDFKTIVVKFSSHDDVKVIVNAFGGKSLTKGLAESYTTSGMTALYDAIGTAFGLVAHTEEHVFVNILTDGEENNSKIYDQARIKSLIGEAKKKGWAVTFMGTTEEAINSAVGLGVSRGNTLSFAKSVGGMNKMSKARSNMSAMYYASSVGASAGGASVDVNNLTDTLDDELKDGK